MNLIETYNGSGFYAQYATSADYASNGQPLSAALTAVPNTYLQNTDLTISDNKVTEISGIPLAGGEVPQGVMVESGLEYDNTEISGYSGSAFKDVALTNVITANSAAWGGSALPISARDGLDLEISGDMLWIGASALNDTLTGKQDITGMTAYQPAGSYLTAVPDTYLQNTDLEISDNKITGISGVPLAAGGGGGDVPEGVMAESGLEYNAVNEISGYNGSAIAQYGAEKQWLTHDDTLVHLSNSAQYALGCNVPVVAQQMGVDETVLWSGTPDTTAYNMTLSDNLNNYNYFVVIWKSYQHVYRDGFVANTTAYPLMLGAAFVNTDGNYEKSLTTWATTDGLTYNWKATIHGSFTGNQSNQWRADVVPLEIHGIGKKV